MPLWRQQVAALLIVACSPQALQEPPLEWWTDGTGRSLLHCREAAAAATRLRRPSRGRWQGRSRRSAPLGKFEAVARALEQGSNGLAARPPECTAPAPGGTLSPPTTHPPLLPLAGREQCLRRTWTRRWTTWISTHSCRCTVLPSSVLILQTAKQSSLLRRESRVVARSARKRSWKPSVQLPLSVTSATMRSASDHRFRPNHPHLLSRTTCCGRRAGRFRCPISRHCPHSCHRLMCQPRMLLRCLRRRSRISPKPCRHLRRRPHARSGGSRHLKSARSSPRLRSMRSLRPSLRRRKSVRRRRRTRLPLPCLIQHLLRTSPRRPPLSRRRRPLPHESASQAIRCRADNASRRQGQAHRPPLPPRRGCWRLSAAGGRAVPYAPAPPSSFAISSTTCVPCFTR